MKCLQSCNYGRLNYFKWVWLILQPSCNFIKNKIVFNLFEVVSKTIWYNISITFVWYIAYCLRYTKFIKKNYLIWYKIFSLAIVKWRRSNHILLTSKNKPISLIITSSVSKFLIWLIFIVHSPYPLFFIIIYLVYNYFWSPWTVYYISK